jgi:hypothetical protein
VRKLLRLISGTHPVRYRKREHIVKEARLALGKRKKTTRI